MDLKEQIESIIKKCYDSPAALVDIEQIVTDLDNIEFSNIERYLSSFMTVIFENVTEELFMPMISLIRSFCISMNSRDEYQSIDFEAAIRAFIPEQIFNIHYFISTYYKTIEVKCMRRKAMRDNNERDENSESDVKPLNRIKFVHRMFLESELVEPEAIPAVLDAMYCMTDIEEFFDCFIEILKTCWRKLEQKSKVWLHHHFRLVHRKIAMGKVLRTEVLEFINQRDQFWINRNEIPAHRDLRDYWPKVTISQIEMFSINYLKDKQAAKKCLSCKNNLFDVKDVLQHYNGEKHMIYANKKFRNIYSSTLQELNDCTICIRHKEIHTARNHNAFLDTVCYTCLKKFESKDSLDKHLKTKAHVYEFLNKLGLKYANAFLAREAQIFRFDDKYKPKRLDVSKVEEKCKEVIATKFQQETDLYKYLIKLLKLVLVEIANLSENMQYTQIMKFRPYVTFEFGEEIENVNDLIHSFVSPVRPFYQLPGYENAKERFKEIELSYDPNSSQVQSYVNLDSDDEPGDNLDRPPSPETEVVSPRHPLSDPFPLDTQLSRAQRKSRSTDPPFNLANERNDENSIKMDWSSISSGSSYVKISSPSSSGSPYVKISSPTLSGSSYVKISSPSSSDIEVMSFEDVESQSDVFHDCDECANRRIHEQLVEAMEDKATETCNAKELSEACQHIYQLESNQLRSSVNMDPSNVEPGPSNVEPDPSNVVSDSSVEDIAEDKPTASQAVTRPEPFPPTGDKNEQPYTLTNAKTASFDKIAKFIKVKGKEYNKVDIAVKLESFLRRFYFNEFIPLDAKCDIIQNFTDKLLDENASRSNN